jgi:hypothetical protein
VQNSGNYKNNQPKQFGLPKMDIRNDNNSNYYGKIFVRQEIEEFLTEIEDYLLEMKQIRILPDKLDLICEELFKVKYNEANLSIAWQWIKFGKWAQNKKELELSDFFPSEVQLDFLKQNFVTKEFYVKILQNEKNKHLLDMSKMKKELEQNLQSQDITELQLKFLNELIKCEKVIIDLKSERSNLLKKITQLEHLTDRLKDKIFSLESIITPT